MRLLAYLGYLLMGIICVILGNFVWATIVGHWAEKAGFKAPAPE